MKIKKDDKVIVIAGKDKGKQGTVTRVLPSLEKVIIEGVNVVKRHSKSRMPGSKGEIIEKTLPVHISNIMLLDPKTSKPTRVGYKVVDGKKMRVAKKSGEIIK